MPNQFVDSPAGGIVDTDYLNRIAIHADELSPTERKISDYLTRQDCLDGNTSISEFAKQAGVSVSSVIRYCKLMGYSGFKELKFHIQQENFRAAVNDLTIRSEDDMATVKKKTTQFAHMSIEKTMQIVDDREMNRAISAVQKAKNVYFCGMGSANGVAQLAAAHFMAMGIRAFAQSDMLMTLRSASFLGPEEVVIAIDFDGCSKGCVDAIMLAKEAGATTILITCVADSLSRKYTDIVLQTAVRNSTNVLNIATLTMCQLSVIQTLMIGVWLEDEKRFAREAERQKPISEMIRYGKQQRCVEKRRILTTG